jgi:hypothetical protein
MPCYRSFFQAWVGSSAESISIRETSEVDVRAAAIAVRGVVVGTAIMLFPVAGSAQDNRTSLPAPIR